MKTKHSSFVKNSHRQCFAAIAAVVERNKDGEIGFRIYTAWEWEEPALTKFFGFFRSTGLYHEVNEENILDAANHGWRIENVGEARKFFPYLFKEERPTHSYPQP